MSVNIPIITTLNDSGIKKAEKAFGALSKKLTGALSVVAIERFASSAIKAFAAEEKAALRLSSVLTNTGKGFESVGVEKFLHDFSLLTGETGDLRGAFSSLYLALKDVGAARSALTLAEDISKGTTYDLGTVASALGQAYMGNVGALKKLKLGLTNTTLASGDLNAMTDELTKLYGGAASKNAETFSGKLDRISVAVDGAKKAIGKGLVDGLMTATSSANIEELQKKIEDFGKNAGTAIATLGKAFKDNFGIIKSTAIALAAIYALDKAMLFAAGVITAMTSVIKVMKVLRATAIGTAIATKFALNPFLGVTAGAVLLAAIGLATEQLMKMDKAAQGAANSVTGALSYNQQRQAQVQKTADAKRLKDALAAESKISAAKKKTAQTTAALSKAQQMFEMDRIQIEAALQGKVSEQDRLRLEMKKALLDEDLTKVNALKILIDDNDVKIRELSLILSTLPKADDPFADWPKIIRDISSLLSDLKLNISVADLLGQRGITLAPDGRNIVVNPTLPKNPTLPNQPSNVIPLPTTNLPTAPQRIPPADLAPLIADLAPVIGKPLFTGSERDFTDTITAIKEAAQSIVEYQNFRAGERGDVNVTVNVAGSVATQQDLSTAITNSILNNQARGGQITFDQIAI
jgi:hypothetical protein